MKFILITIFTLLASTSTFAQRLLTGPKAGMNVSWIRGDVEDISPLVGFYLGQTTNIGLSPHLSLGFDVLFSMQGGEYTLKSGFPWSDYTIRMRLYNANLPVYLKVYVAEGSGFNFLAGVQPGIIVRARTGDDGQNRVTEAMSVMDFSIPLGLGYDFSNGLGIDFRYVIGVTDLGEDKDDEFNFYGNVLQLGMAYRFGK